MTVKQLGVDLIDVSSGGLMSKCTNSPWSGLSGSFCGNDPKRNRYTDRCCGTDYQMQRRQNEIISSGKADLVLIARESLRNPNFPLTAAKELGVEIDYWPLQYLRAK